MNRNIVARGYVHMSLHYTKTSRAEHMFKVLIAFLLRTRAILQIGQRRNEICLSRVAVQDGSIFAHAHTGNTANRAATEIGQ